MNSINCKILLAFVSLLLLFSYGLASNKEKIIRVTGNDVHANLKSKKQIMTVCKDLLSNQNNIKIGDVHFRELSPKKQKIIVAWFIDNSNK